MNNIFISLCITLFAGLSTVIGGLIIYLKPRNIDKFISYSLTLSFSIVLFISILDLIPEAFKEIIIINKSLFKTFLIIISILIFAYFLMLILNKYIAKVEYSGGSLYKLGIISMIILALHNFPEGIATFMTSCKDIKLGLSLGIAIMMHNIPEGILIAVPLFYSSNKKGRSILYTLISGLAEPLGAILAYILLKDYINSALISYILIFVAGIMIYMSINNIFPEIQKYKINKTNYIIFILGLILVVINIILFK